MSIYKDLLLILISFGVIAGLIVESKAETEVDRNFNISTPEGNFKFDNDREFIEYMEGW